VRPRAPAAEPRKDRLRIIEESFYTRQYFAEAIFAPG
jgi:hypothetical protein